MYCRTFNPVPGRGRSNPISKQEAMQNLVDVVSEVTAGIKMLM